MRGRHWIIVASLAMACGNDEDVGGSSNSPTTTPPDGTTTTTGETPTTSDTDSDTLVDSDTQSTNDETTGPDETTATAPPDPLMVDCGALPNGAVAAEYEHQPSADGGDPSYSWAASGLPDGLTIDEGTGKISGTPTSAGMFSVTITVTDQDSVVVEAQCPDVTINDKLHVDLDAFAGPCLEAGESILDFVTGGDGTEIVCATPKGVGDGDLPAGITIDPASCEIEGSIAETRYGTWVWIVRARQSGVDVFAPYCATQSQQGPNAYTILGNHSGGMDNVLEPLEVTYDPSMPLKIDGDADPAFEVTRDVCGDSCFFGFAYSVTQSPLGSGACLTDDDKCLGLCPLVADAAEPDGDKQIGCSLVPKAMNPKIGFAHELWAKGDTPPDDFATRPFVQQWSIDYCISSLQTDCNTKAAILANGDSSNLEFAVILRPQP
jgi:hypothetical protein